ncbi:hypothetical protein BET03_07790 [Thermohalobacter berrensis]|uniref:Fluoride-specific ion channel FluC n=1 Tax=Thermohalobacter berrensis TaxID=99594 RepID=A0A419T9S0_9FIRM|nr:hypothetical protein BET03_07790 [Thermohalobacter berrensis]
MKKIILLGTGGFIGSNLRYWISVWVSEFVGMYFPYGTLAVNVLGCFILGFIMIYGTEVIELNPQIKLFIGTGMLGALTTFSTFSFETISLIRESSYSLAILNILLNIIIGLAGVWLGFIVAKALA